MAVFCMARLNSQGRISRWIVKLCCMKKGEAVAGQVYMDEIGMEHIGYTISLGAGRGELLLDHSQMVMVLRKSIHDLGCRHIVQRSLRHVQRSGVMLAQMRGQLEPTTTGKDGHLKPPPPLSITLKEKHLQQQQQLLKPQQRRAASEPGSMAKPETPTVVSSVSVTIMESDTVSDKPSLTVSDITLITPEYSSLTFQKPLSSDMSRSNNAIDPDDLRLGITMGGRNNSAQTPHQQCHLQEAQHQHEQQQQQQQQQQQSQQQQYQKHDEQEPAKLYRSNMKKDQDMPALMTKRDDEETLNIAKQQMTLMRDYFLNMAKENARMGVMNSNENSSTQDRGAASKSQRHNSNPAKTADQINTRQQPSYKQSQKMGTKINDDACTEASIKHVAASILEGQNASMGADRSPAFNESDKESKAPVSKHQMAMTVKNHFMKMAKQQAEAEVMKRPRCAMNNSAQDSNHDTAVKQMQQRDAMTKSMVLSELLKVTKPDLQIVESQRQYIDQLNQYQFIVQPTEQKQQQEKEQAHQQHQWEKQQQQQQQQRNRNQQQLIKTEKKQPKQEQNGQLTQHRQQKEVNNIKNQNVVCQNNNVEQSDVNKRLTDNFTTDMYLKLSMGAVNNSAQDNDPPKPYQHHVSPKQQRHSAVPKESPKSGSKSSKPDDEEVMSIAKQQMTLMRDYFMTMAKQQQQDTGSEMKTGSTREERTTQGPGTSRETPKYVQRVASPPETNEQQEQRWRLSPKHQYQQQQWRQHPQQKYEQQQHQLLMQQQKRRQEETWVQRLQQGQQKQQQQQQLQQQQQQQLQQQQQQKRQQQYQQQQQHQQQHSDRIRTNQMPKDQQQGESQIHSMPTPTDQKLKERHRVSAYIENLQHREQVAAKPYVPRTSMELSQKERQETTRADLKEQKPGPSDLMRGQQVPQSRQRYMTRESKSPESQTTDYRKVQENEYWYKYTNRPSPDIGLRMPRHADIHRKSYEEQPIIIQGEAHFRRRPSPAQAMMSEERGKLTDRRSVIKPALVGKDTVGEPKPRKSILKTRRSPKDPSRSSVKIGKKATPPKKAEAVLQKKTPPKTKFVDKAPGSRSPKNILKKPPSKQSPKQRPRKKSEVKFKEGSEIASSSTQHKEMPKVSKLSKFLSWRSPDKSKQKQSTESKDQKSTNRISKIIDSDRAPNLSPLKASDADKGKHPDDTGETGGLKDQGDKQNDAETTNVPAVLGYLYHGKTVSPLENEISETTTETTEVSSTDKTASVTETENSVSNQGSQNLDEGETVSSKDELTGSDRSSVTDNQREKSRKQHQHKKNHVRLEVPNTRTSEQELLKVANELLLALENPDWLKDKSWTLSGRSSKSTEDVASSNYSSRTGASFYNFDANYDPLLAGISSNSYAVSINMSHNDSSMAVGDRTDSGRLTLESSAVSQSVNEKGSNSRANVKIEGAGGKVTSVKNADNSEKLSGSGSTISQEKQPARPPGRSLDAKVKGWVVRTFISMDTSIVVNKRYMVYLVSTAIYTLGKV